MSLQVWLPLNGNLLNKGLSESSITNNGATINNNGKIGKCYSFTKNAYLDLTNPSFITTFTEISISFWIKINSWNTNWDTIFQAGLGTTPWTSYSIGILRNQSNFLCFAISDGNSSSQGNYKTNNLTLETWIHLTFIYKAGHCLIYENGILKLDYTTTIIPNFSNITSIKIGGLPSNYKSDCLINDFRLYDHALSLKEIKEIYKTLIIHYPLDYNGLPFTNPNLYKGSHSFTGTWLNSANWTTVEETYYDFVVKQKSTSWGGLCQNIPATTGDIFTISFWGKIDLGGQLTSVHRSSLGNVTTGLTLLGGNFSSPNSGYWVTKTEDGTKWKRYWATVKIDSDDITYLQWRIENSVAGKNLYVAGLKIERGNKATPWCPNEEDFLYSILGYNDNTIYDCSGYENNGITNNITYSNNTPKYMSSSLLNSTTTSWIKISDNNWIAQGATEMTINIWVYQLNWTTQTNPRIFSCTESGGFNTEAANAGYIRFPINVYTAADFSTYTYKYSNTMIKLEDLTSGWHMFTFIYNLTGVKIYIDGLLYSTYDFTSYGIHFNLNARLYLGCEANTANPSAPYFTGKLSDFRLYYTTLSDKDIKLLYLIRAIADKNNNFYSPGNFIEEGYSNLIEHFYGFYIASSYAGCSFIQNLLGLILNQQLWLRQNLEYIPINPEGKTYKYDIIYSNTAGNLLYIGWERFDAEKTSRSNSACVYVIQNNPSSDHKYTRVTGTVNLSTDTVNPCAFIRLRILNKWGGSSADTLGKAIIHYLSLKEYSSTDSFTPMKIEKTGVILTSNLILIGNINKININKPQEIFALTFIEN